MPLLALAAACVPLLAQDPPTSTELVDRARTLLPAYTGQQRSFLAVSSRRQVEAASLMMAAALALAPEDTYALWWRGHAEVLLGEDSKSRGFAADSEQHFAQAFEALDAALELQPDYAWAWYARASAQRSLGRLGEALSDFEECVAVANRLADAAQDEAGRIDALQTRFYARQWRADLRMQLLDFDTSRQEFRAFYADNGNNQWNLGFKLAETYLRSRDFAGAREVFRGLLEVEGYDGFDGVYAQLGYLAALLGDSTGAAKRLNEALAREQIPGLYLRLWLLLVSEGEGQERARNTLAGFVNNPPRDTSAWDLALGRFVLGEIEADAFLDLGRAEEERRKLEGEELGDLMCEVWFYVGRRRLVDGEADAARQAFAQAVSYRPAAFKWEWAFARRRFAELASGEPSVPAAELLPERAERILWHRAGQPASTADLPAELRPGDLVTFLVEAGGSKTPRLVVVGQP